MWDEGTASVAEGRAGGVGHLDFMSKAPHSILQTKMLKKLDNKDRGKTVTSGLKDHNQQLQPPLGCWLLTAPLKDQPALLRSRDRMRDNGKEDPSWNKRKAI